MTTLHVQRGGAATARSSRSRPCESVSVDADLPAHAADPRARASAGRRARVRRRRRVAVATDGTLLPQERDGRLPAVKVDALPGDGRLGEGRRRPCSCASSPRAPDELRPLLERAYRAARRRAGGARRRARPLRFGAPIRLGRQVGGGGAGAGGHAARPGASHRPADPGAPSPRTARAGGAEQAAAQRHGRLQAAARRATRRRSTPLPETGRPEPAGPRATPTAVEPKARSRVRASTLARGEASFRGRAAEVVQNIARTGNLTYRAESRTDRQAAKVSTPLRLKPVGRS